MWQAFWGDPWATISAMYSFAQVDASNTTKWFKQQKYIVSQVWRLEVRNQNAGRVGSSEAALLDLYYRWPASPCALTWPSSLCVLS